MSTGTHLITAEQFAEMHFDVPVELVRGEIVYLYGEDGMTRPGPKHGGVCGNVYNAIRSWALPRSAGYPTTNDSEIRTTSDPDSVRGADVAFFRMDTLPGGVLPEPHLGIVPAVCVEVLSPSNRPGEIAEKIEEYLACGIEEVWIIDPDDRSVDVHCQDAAAERFQVGERLASRALPEFVCPVASLFLGVWRP